MAKGHKDKVAVITGASNGIGQAFARRLAEDGVHIAIADVAPSDETVKMVERAGRQALASTCDVASEPSVAAMAQEVQKTFGRCDIVINCAGIFPLTAFEQMTFAEWRRVLSINVDSLFLVTSAFVPGMKQRGWGRVVNMGSSTFGSVTSGFVHYVTSKGGVMGFTRALAGELGQYRDHRQRHCAKPDADTRRAGAQAAPRRCHHRRGVRTGRAAPVDPPRRGAGGSGRDGLYLTSDDAAFITGQVLNVSGGRIFSSAAPLRRATMSFRLVPPGRPWNILSVQALADHCNIRRVRRRRRRPRS